MRVLRYVVMMFGFVGALSAQTEQLIVRTYGTVDGLPANGVSGIIEDSLGALWVATDRGIVVSWLDGFVVDRSFNTQDIRRGQIHLAPSRSDNGYLFVSRGGSAYEVAYGREWGWDGYNLRPLLPAWTADSTHGTGFTAVVESRSQEIVLGTAGTGLWIVGVPAHKKSHDFMAYRGAPLRRVFLKETVNDLACDSSGTVWVATERGLFRLVGDRCVAFDDVVLRNVRITSLAVQRDGTLWIGTDRGLYVRNIGKVEFIAAVGRGPVSAVAVSATGTVWAGGPSHGVVRLEGTHAVRFDERDGLPGGAVRSLFEDASGNLWVGTDRGVAKILPFTYREYAGGRDLPHGRWFSGLRARDGAIWFGGTGMLVRFFGDRPTVHVAPRAGDLTFRQLIEDADGNVWALTERGLMRFDGTSFRFFPDTSARAEELRGSVLTYDRREGIYVLAPHALKRLRGTAFETVAVPPGPRPFNDAAFDSAGNLWFTSWTSCSRRAPDGTTIKIPALDRCLKVLTCADGSVAILDQAYGVVFQREIETARFDSIPYMAPEGRDPNDYTPFTDGFVTRDGRRFVFYRVSRLREQIAPGRSFGSVEYTSAGALTPVFERNDGKVLMAKSTSGGLGALLFDPHQKTVLPQPLFEGLVVKRYALDEDTPEFSDFAGAVERHWQKLLEDDAGTLWCAIGNTILALPRERRGVGLQPPIVASLRAGDHLLLPGYVGSWGRITTASVWTQDERHGAAPGFPNDFHFYFPAEDNDLQFTLWSLDRQKELGTAFQVRLDPADSGWNTPTLDAVFSYRDLQQGTHTFRVRSMSRDGHVSPERSVIVSLVVPFWRSTWFPMASVLTVVYLFIRIAARRMRRLQNEHQRVTKQAVQDNELRMARVLQLGMLPQECPELPGYEIAARSTPATEVGGDFYDFLRDGGRVGIAVGDVSGHGITGAMIVGMARTSVRFASSRFGGPSRILTMANERLRQDISKNVFIAMFYGLLDPRRRTLRYICAGQPTPILIRNGSAAFLPHGKGDRFPLGIVPRVSYREERLALRPGDTVVIYSDGIVEAMNPAREEFGFDQFLKTLERHADRTAAELIDAVSAEVTAHAHGADQEDDMTLVVLRVRKERRS